MVAWSKHSIKYADSQASRLWMEKVVEDVSMSFVVQRHRFTVLWLGLTECPTITVVFTLSGVHGHLSSTNLMTLRIGVFQEQRRCYATAYVKTTSAAGRYVPLREAHHISAFDLPENVYFKFVILLVVLGLDTQFAPRCNIYSAKRDQVRYDRRKDSEFMQARSENDYVIRICTCWTDASIRYWS